MEIEVTMAVICLEIWVFRWVITRMPVLRDPPAWTKESKEKPTGSAGGEVLVTMKGS